MKIRRILLLLAILTALVCFAGCGDDSDGNTSGSAESNGVISDESASRGDSMVSTDSDMGSSDESGADSDGAGGVLSDVMSDAGDVVSDVVSGVEDGASDLFGDSTSETQG